MQFFLENSYSLVHIICLNAPRNQLEINSNSTLHNMVHQKNSDDSIVLINIHKIQYQKIFGIQMTY
jgi:ABC-type Na+ transport system ATPase subunit NatA